MDSSANSRVRMCYRKDLLALRRIFGLLDPILARYTGLLRRFKIHGQNDQRYIVHLKKCNLGPGFASSAVARLVFTDTLRLAFHPDKKKGWQKGIAERDGRRGWLKGTVRVGKMQRK